MSHDNLLWGSERIRGDLLKLGIVVSKRSIRRYRWRKPTPAGSQRWQTFLSNEIKGIWAADLLVVQTATYRTLYVLFFISHQRRELIHFDVTASPSAAWIWRQLIEATPRGRHPRYLIHDRDAVYGKHFGSRAAKLGIASLRTPPRSPRAHAIAERLVRTLRSEVLDHVIVINDQHLHAVLAEFALYYNRDRPHRSLNLQPPLPTLRQSAHRRGGDRPGRDGRRPVPGLTPKLNTLLPPFSAPRVATAANESGSIGQPGECPLGELGDPDRRVQPVQGRTQAPKGALLDQRTCRCKVAHCIVAISTCQVRLRSA